jgi:hypothetical protein
LLSLTDAEAGKSGGITVGSVDNEPVAWMQTWENQDGELKHTVNIEQIGKNDIPLYTHPAKTLTDEEIIKLKDEYTKVPSKPWSGIPMAHFDVCGFARAILKKASEK